MLLLLPVQAAGDEFDPQGVGLDVVGVAVRVDVAVEHGAVQVHLALDVQQVADLQQVFAEFTAHTERSSER